MSKFKYTEQNIRLVMESFPGNKMQMATRLNVGIDAIDRWVESLYKVPYWHQFRQQHTGSLCLTSIATAALPFEVSISNPQYYENESMFKYDTRLNPTTAIKSVRLSAISTRGSRLRPITVTEFRDYGTYWAPVEEGRWLKHGDTQYWIGLNKTDLTWDLRIKGMKVRITPYHLAFVARISLAELTSR